MPSKTILARIERKRMKVLCWEREIPLSPLTTQNAKQLTHYQQNKPHSNH